MRRAPVWIFEGTWWDHHESSKVLPYFQAVSSTVAPLDIGHRTFRSADDLEYWIKKIPRGTSAFVYVACHGNGEGLWPVSNTLISVDELCATFTAAKDGAIGFLHFGTCGVVDGTNRRASLQRLRRAARARFVSGFTRPIDWFQSTLFDVVIAAELFVPYYLDARHSAPKLAKRASDAYREHQALARRLGFTGLVSTASGGETMIPARLR